MQFIAILKLIISVLPLIITAIKLIEDAMPGTGKGEEKLIAARAIIESAYQASTDASVKFDAVWPVMKKTISGLVAAFNASGVFKK